MDRLKQKVASSSSRIIASLQQAATGTFQTSDTRPLQEQHQQASIQVSPDQVGSRLMADADAFAHLTQEEREILLEVFKKEAEFQRDTIIQMGAASQSNSDPLNQEPPDQRLFSQQQQQEYPNRVSSRRSSQRDRFALAPKQTSSSASSTRQQLQHYQYESPSPAATLDTSNSSSTVTYLASARSSITPSSRPASSLFADTPTNQVGALRRESSARAGSSCSSLTQAQQQQQQPLGQCRICRKVISTKEPCHLCSNCNQFICDDCASYSATDQTLRLNQNDLRLDMIKVSSESNASSNSSSGCSSLSAGPPTHQQVINTASDGQARPPFQQPQLQQVRQLNRPYGDQRQAAVQQQQQPTSNSQSQDRRTNPRFSSHQHMKLQRHGPSIDPSAAGQPSATGTRYSAHKTQSNPVVAPMQDLTQAKSNHLPAAHRNSGSSESATSSQTPGYEGIASGSGGGSRPALIDRFQQQQHRQQTRRASVAVPDGSMRGRGSGKSAMGTPPMIIMNRKQSSGDFVMMQTRTSSSSSQASLANNFSYVYEQPQSGGGRSGPAESLMLSAGQQRQSIQQQQQQQLMHENTDNNQQQQQRHFIMGQPLTMVTASSELSVRGSQSRLESSASARGSIVGGALIPIPADQIHLRRLSDQSNLVRRSSIIADTIDVVNLQHRNRSHSNIDTVSYAFYQPQFQPRPLDYSDENLHESYAAPQYQQQQQQNPYQQMSSIITPYSQKHRGSSEDLHSDSSSDIEEDLQVCQTNLELDNDQPNEYFAPPRGYEYVATTTADQQQQQMMSSFVDGNAAGIPIPSVSVSEFNSSQQRLNQIQQRQPQPQPPLMQLEQLMSSPIQINVATEQAIQQQQQRQELVQQYLPAGLHQQLPVGYSALAPRRGSSGRILPQVPSEQSQSLLDLPNSAQAAPASGSHQFGTTGAVVEGRNSISNNSVNRLSGIGAGQQRLGSTLDLPAASQTIRRASAPEGQNIKIIVNDMDGTMMRSNGCCSGSMTTVIDPSGALVMQPSNYNNQRQHHHNLKQYGKQGELYERLVLYRDDSLDPNTNMARGFGLQVMGGKIDEVGKLQACVVWILAGGPADKVGLKCGDKIIEWDSKCLVNMTYEQVADVIESSANIAELLVKSAHRLEVQPNSASVVRSQRRLSHQTERDLQKVLQQQQSHHDQQCQQRASHQTGLLLDASSGLQQSHQQAISAGNSPLRSGTGRKLPQIPGGGLSQDGSLRALNNNSAAIGQMKLNSSSTSQLEQQTVSYYAVSSGQPQQNSKLLLGQLQSDQRTLSAQNNSLNSNKRPQQVLWYQPQSQQPAYEQLLSNQTEVFGLIGLQVNVDERAAQLEISVLSAINVNLNPSSDYLVRLKVLPESNGFKACKTLPRSDMNWNETFLFQNFPVDQISRMALEIGIWLHDEAPRLSTQLPQPICEAMIPIQSARERNIDFWPLRQAPNSPQARRKSLNDLLESHHRQQDDRFVGAQLSACSQRTNNLPINRPTNLRTSDSAQQQQQHNLMQYQTSQAVYLGENGAFVRGRSSSNRNLPDTSKLRAQPRRASDEVAGSTGQRLSTRLSPAASRRSISVINVGPDGAAGLSQPSSRLGSQSNLIKSQQQRRDSTLMHQQQEGSHPSSGDSPIHKLTRQASGEGLTPSGRRSSLVGIHNMIGYASQKNSLSDASEQRATAKSSLVTSMRPSQAASAGGSQLGSPSASVDVKQRLSNQHEGGQRALASSNSGQPSPNTTPVKRVASGSHRGSVEQSTPKLERKGSFAMLTLRKLKRTMSLTKGSDQEAPDSNQSSRRSSSECEAEANTVDDLGLTRRLIGQTVDYVGRLKLSFIMTKGQLEIDVICAQGLKYDLESSLGVYVKMYLKGRNKSNKRKTRLVQPWESPIFKQLIKYDGCLVDNKSLEISLWQKQGGLKGKMPIGFTEVRLSELSLNQLQISWYNLRPMDMMCSSSIED